MCFCPKFVENDVFIEKKAILDVKLSNFVIFDVKIDSFCIENRLSLLKCFDLPYSFLENRSK